MSRARALLLACQILFAAFFVANRQMAPAAAAQQRTILQPVLDGLDQPVFVSSAHDASRRLFILEQPGRIKVLPPGGSVPKVFLDISDRVLAGGEQGLLGLAFHPRFSENGRFFLDYTRKPDGATVIAEYRVSSANPDVADTSERVLLTIPQPYTNHNGGMVEFGPDGYLYIGMGDGGSGNDPENRAQNLQELLGKILRIDVDRSDGGLPYGIPPSNPFAGSTSARPEIFALGLRNPWRFSFDRANGKMYAGDVGQGLVEEIDIIIAGGNYGWRVLEGTRCTDLGPAPCNAPGFIPPITQYGHDGGKCSVTGGYAYRGRQDSLPQGTYVYADFCSGEIFTVQSGTGTLLLDTDLNISSFGEDEDGEIYVVGLGGTVHRFVNPDAPARPAYYFPRLLSTNGSAAGEDQFTGFAAANLDTAAASLTFTAYDSSGALIQGTGISNPVTVDLPGSAQLARLESQIFGSGIRALDRTGWVRLESSTVRLASSFLAFDARLSFLGGATGAPVPLNDFLLSGVVPSSSWKIYLANPRATPGTVVIRAFSAGGDARAVSSRSLGPHEMLVTTVAGLFPGLDFRPDDYLRASASQGAAALEFLEKPAQPPQAAGAQDATAGGTVLYAPQYVMGGGYTSVLSVTNLDLAPGNVTIRLFSENGTVVGTPRLVPIAAMGRILVSDPAFFGDFGTSMVQGSVEIRSSGPLLAGSVTFSDPGNRVFSTTVPLVSILRKRLVYSQVASDSTYYTGIAVANPGGSDSVVRIEVFDGSGHSVVSGDFSIPAGGRSARVLTDLFPGLAGRSVTGGRIEVTAANGLASCATFGTVNLTALSALEAQGRD